MAAEKVVGGAASAHERRGERASVGGGGGGEEINGSNSSGKQPVAMAGGGGAGGGYHHRWSGDAVPLKRRRVGLMSNGAGVSDDAGASSDERHAEEEEEDPQEDEVEEDEVEEAEELSQGDDDDVGEADGEGAGVGEDDDEDEEVYEATAEEDVDDHLTVPQMDRGGCNGSHHRRRPPAAYEMEEEAEEEMEEEDEGYEEDLPIVPDSPPMRVRGGGRERSRDSFSGDGVGRDASDDTQERRAAFPMFSRGGGMVAERGQSSSSEPLRHREIAMKGGALPQKPARGMANTISKKKKSKAPDAVVPAPLPPLVHRPPHRNGAESTQSKKEKALAAAPAVPASAAAAPKWKPVVEALPTPPPPPAPPRDRGRFTSENKARVTLERAREILAAVKAAMVKDPKRFSSSRPAVGENSSSDDESVSPLQPPPPSRSAPLQHHRHPQPKVVVKSEGSAAKKRSRPSKGRDKDAAPRSRKPKVDAGYHLQAAAGENALFRSRPYAGNESSYKTVARFAAGGADDREVFERKQFSEDNGYDRQITTVEKKVRKRKKGKDVDQGSVVPSLTPGSVLRDESWRPPSSPFGLIQENLYKDPWKVLLSCMLLNKTAGRQFLVQMHKVIWDLFSLCPDAETAINMDTAKIAEKVYSLGLQNKRAKMIQRFSLEYLRGDWTNVSQLHGIGKYAVDAYAIFCQGLWREVEPDDHMLSKYWKWLCDTDGLGTAFTEDMA